MRKKMVDLWGIVLLCYVALGFSLIGAQETELKKAMDMINQGRAAEAVPLLEQQSAKEPQSFDVQLALGMALLEAGNYDSAQGALERAVVLNPGSVPAHYTLAMLYESRRNTARAVEEWMKVQQLTGDQSLKDLAAKHLQQLKGAQ
jgi:Tfp pilus assembly protein PilF